MKEHSVDYFIQLQEEIKKWREKVQLYEGMAEETLTHDETFPVGPDKPEGNDEQLNTSNESFRNEFNAVDKELSDKVAQLEKIENKINLEEIDVLKLEFSDLQEKNSELQEEISNLFDVNNELKDKKIKLNENLHEEVLKYNHTVEHVKDIESQIEQIGKRRIEVQTSLQEKKNLVLLKEEEEMMLNNELMMAQALSTETKSLFNEVDDKCQVDKEKLESYLNKYTACKNSVESKQILISELKNENTSLRNGLSNSSYIVENSKLLIQALDIRIKDLEHVVNILARWSRNVCKEIKVDHFFNQSFQIEQLIDKHKDMKNILVDALNKMKGKQKFLEIEESHKKINDLEKALAGLKIKEYELDKKHKMLINH